MRAFQQEVVRTKYGDKKSCGMRGRTPQDISVMTWAHGECRCHSDVSTPIQDGKSWGQQRGALFCELKSHPVQVGLAGSGPVIPNPRDTTKCPCMQPSRLFTFPACYGACCRKLRVWTNPTWPGGSPNVNSLTCKAVFQRNRRIFPLYMWQLLKLKARTVTLETSPPEDNIIWFVSLKLCLKTQTKM